MIAYMTWLGKDLPENVENIAGISGPPDFNPPNRKANLTAGEQLYKVYCMSCHGADGEGYRALSDRAGGGYVVPALWGEGSYNNGAGMNRLLTIAAFLKGNMPLGAPWQHPTLTDEQAYDIGAYVNSHERPEMANLAEDYPDLTNKPVDSPYGPYADDFPQEQHKYGPFQPIMEAREKATQGQ
jgi:thiosulfate dehydrogenase